MKKLLATFLFLGSILSCQSPVEPLERDNIYDPGSSVYKSKPPRVQPQYSAENKTVSFSFQPYDRETHGAVVEKSLQDSVFRRVATLPTENLAYTDASKNFSPTTIFRFAEFTVKGSDTTFTDWHHIPINFNAPPINVTNNGGITFTWEKGHPLLEGYYTYFTSDVLPDSVFGFTETQENSINFTDIPITPGFRFKGVVQGYVFNNNEKVVVTQRESVLSFHRVKDYEARVTGIDSIQVSWNLSTPFEFEVNLEISHVQNFSEIVATQTINQRNNPFHVRYPLSKERLEEGLFIRAVPSYQGISSLAVAAQSQIKMELTKPELNVFSEGNGELQVVLRNNDDIEATLLPPTAVTVKAGESVLRQDTLWFVQNPQRHTLKLETQTLELTIEAKFLYSDDVSTVQMNPSFYLDRELMNGRPSWASYKFPDHTVLDYKGDVYLEIDSSLFMFDINTEEFTSLIPRSHRRTRMLVHAGKIWQIIPPSIERYDIYFEGRQHTISYRNYDLATKTDHISELTLQGPETSVLNYIVGSADGTRFFLRYTQIIGGGLQYIKRDYIYNSTTNNLVLLDSGTPNFSVMASNDRLFVSDSKGQNLVLDENLNEVLTLPGTYGSGVMQYYPEFSIYISHYYQATIYDSNTGEVKADNVSKLLFPFGSNTGIFSDVDFRRENKGFYLGAFDSDERTTLFSYNVNTQTSRRFYFYSPKSGYLYSKHAETTNGTSKQYYYRARIIDGYTSQPIKRWK